MVKVSILYQGGQFKDYDLHKVVKLSPSIEQIDASSLNSLFNTAPPLGSYCSIEMSYIF